LVMIGDDIPHSPEYPLNKLHLDWRKEAQNLGDMGVSIYSVQCLSRSYANSFYAKMAENTGGHHLNLDQFNSILDLILAIIYTQQSPERLQEFELEVVKHNRMSRALDLSFGVLSGQPRDKKTGRFIKVATEGDLVPVPFGRFQIMDVPSDIDIRGFVEGNDIPFLPGKGFYEFTKTEEIQEKKEVVLQDKKTGDMFSGVQARELIGIPLGTRGRVKPAELGYRVFVQSTSYNRKLKAGSKFLYEVNMSR